jgi:RNA polymerase sigma-70 factor (ECF subfamily)
VEAVHGTTPAPDVANSECDAIGRLQAGDTAALAELLDRHGEALMHYLVSILGGRDAAEDAFQDTWVKVAQGIGGFDRRLPFGPWLFRIARNHAYDRQRWTKRWGFLPLVGDGPVSGAEGGDAGAAFGSGAPAAAPNPAHRSSIPDRIAARDLVERVTPGLSPAFREVIELRFYADLSYDEIAEVCRVPIGTVKSRLRRALDHLAAAAARLEQAPERAEPDGEDGR